MKQGFFNMNDVQVVVNKKSMGDARCYLVDRISAFEGKATPENIQKALNMIDKATSIARLAIAISNFILAHPSENQKVIR